MVVWCGNNIWYEGQFYRTVGTLRSYHLILLVRLHHLASIIITNTGINTILIFTTAILIMISLKSLVSLKEEVDRWSTTLDPIVRAGSKRIERKYKTRMPGQGNLRWVVPSRVFVCLFVCTIKHKKLKFLKCDNIQGVFLHWASLKSSKHKKLI